MATQIFLNLATNNLEQSKAFFRALGYDFNPEYTNDDAACLVISDTIFAMLHTPKSFSRFTPLPICDARKSTEVLIAISLESRAAVEEMTRKALAAGGTIFREPDDHGFMYCQAIQDLDGHVWELFAMIPQEKK